MRWKYALFELNNYRKIVTFIALQTLIVFIVVIAIVSIITSRAERYNSVRDLMKGKGQVFSVVSLTDTSNKDLIQTKKMIENCMDSAEVNGCYDWGFSIENDEQNVVMTGYDDKLWQCYSPRLDSGRWFTNQDKESTDILEVVIAQKRGKGGRYKVGDMISAESTFAEDCSFDGKGKEMKLKVIGIVANGASLLGDSSTSDSKRDYRDLFWDYYDYYSEGIYIFGIQSDLYQFKMQHARRWFTKMGGLSFFSWKTNDSDSIRDNQVFLLEHGVFLSETDFESLREHSEKYVFEQLKYLLPIIIPLCVLTILSTACNMAIITKKSLKNYAVYYINGLSWKKCRGICFRSNLILEVGALGLALTALFVVSCFHLVDASVISLDFPQIGICIILSFLFSTIGIGVSYLEIKNVTVNDILREADPA